MGIKRKHIRIIKSRKENNLKTKIARLDNSIYNFINYRPRPFNRKDIFKTLRNRFPLLKFEHVNKYNNSNRYINVVTEYKKAKLSYSIYF